MDYKAVLLKHINLKGLIEEILDSEVEPKLKELVANSSNKIDDGLEPLLYPMIKKAVLEALPK